MLELLTDPAAWASLATLALLEIVLGVADVVFLSIVSSRLPEHQQPAARRIGLLLALGQSIYLLRVGRRMRAQLRSLNQPRDDNPLGRLLGLLDESFSAGESDLESLELKLDEGVIRETPKLERGQSVVKLLAGVAPLLGLLGTVTGMIATFQAITLFGTGDPKLMADGISQALVTTVLGLVVAIPLLFLHSLLSARSRSLVRILDEQAAGLIARRMESGKRD